MKLKKLLKDISVQAIKGSKEIEITGVCANSKLVSPGNLFIAKKGFTHDGAQFIDHAVQAGAVAVLTEMFDPFLKDVVQVIHPHVAEIEAGIAAEYYRHPSNDLQVIGITGTNGKTTTAYLVKHLLDAVKKSCGLIGTIEWIVGKNYLPSSQTTPDAITNQKLLHEMIINHCTSAVMEVSSHALDQGRIRGINFDAALFTNLSAEHLDYHQTMEEYASAKAKLFTALCQPSAKYKKKTKWAIVNADSPWSDVMVKNCPACILRYGIDQGDLVAREIEMSFAGMHFKVAYQNQEVSFSTNLIGRFNVYNCLAAIAVGISQNISLEDMAEGLKTFKAVPGRLEKVSNQRGLNIFVDYAHTDDSLRNVLKTLKEMSKGRIITVFGCGGNRDPGKRPKMAAVAEEHSHFSFVTTDNPRNEEPDQIIKQILNGFEDAKKYAVEPDRKTAIEKAVKMATADDIVLIAGKGHETYQMIGHQTLAFDDRLEAKAACEI